MGMWRDVEARDGNREGRGARVWATQHRPSAARQPQTGRQAACQGHRPHSRVQGRGSSTWAHFQPVRGMDWGLQAGTQGGGVRACAQREAHGRAREGLGECTEPAAAQGGTSQHRAQLLPKLRTVKGAAVININGHTAQQQSTSTPERGIGPCWFRSKVDGASAAGLSMRPGARMPREGGRLIATAIIILPLPQRPAHSTDWRCPRRVGAL
jgi:hypothetical protein